MGFDMIVVDSCSANLESSNLYFLRRADDQVWQYIEWWHPATELARPIVPKAETNVNREMVGDWIGKCGLVGCDYLTVNINMR